MVCMSAMLSNEMAIKSLSIGTKETLILRRLSGKIIPSKRKASRMVGNLPTIPLPPRTPPRALGLPGRARMRLRRAESAPMFVGAPLMRRGRQAQPGPLRAPGGRVKTSCQNCIAAGPECVVHPVTQIRRSPGLDPGPRNLRKKRPGSRLGGRDTWFCACHPPKAGTSLNRRDL